MAALLIALAVVIFVRQRASRVARLFCVMIGLVAAWMLLFMLTIAAARETVALPLARAGLAVIALLPASVYDFSATALRLHTRRKYVVHITWTVAGILAALSLLTAELVGGVTHFAWGFYPRLGILGVPFLVFFFGVLVLHLIEYTIAYRATRDPARRRRIRNLLVSFVIVYLAGVDFIPMFGVEQHPVGYVPVLAFILFAWTGIREHRLHPITAARAATEIIETMADALFVIDAEARIRLLNPAAREMFGWSESEIAGKPIDMLELVDPEATISKTLHDIVRRAPIRDEERVFRDREGNAINASVSISPLRARDVAGGAVVIIRDIRSRKHAELALRDFMVRLQQSNRELEDFAYVASHDLQEPLRKIQAFGERLRRKYGDVLNEEGRDSLERMHAAARRMQTLINDLLAFSRVTTKARPFVRVDLGVIAREVVHDLEVRIQQLDGRVEIGELPSIDADPLQMRQLLQNLIGNALKFHRDGVPPVVTVGGTANLMRAEIVVADNGIGFDEKYADRIFTMFERLHGRGAYEGTGIGLAICRKIAHRHGGEIRAESAPGAGSKFTVVLPVHHVEVSHDA